MYTHKVFLWFKSIRTTPNLFQVFVYISESGNRLSVMAENISGWTPNKPVIIRKLCNSEPSTAVNSSVDYILWARTHFRTVYQHWIEIPSGFLRNQKTINSSLIQKQLYTNIRLTTTKLCQVLAVSLVSMVRVREFMETYVRDSKYHLSVILSIKPWLLPDHRQKHTQPATTTTCILYKGINNFWLFV